MIKKSRKRPIAEINVVPYIDVMLVLLVIFMITTPLLTQGVQVDLPTASAKPVESQEEPLIISVDKAGLYYLNANQNPYQAEEADTIVSQISTELANAKAAGHSRAVFVKGDRAVDYGKVVAIMGLLQEAGIDKIGLVSESEEKR